MNESYILNSSSLPDYSIEQVDIAQKKIEKFMLHLKNFYDYDEVTLYTYDNISSNTDIRIIDDAIRFIHLAKPHDSSRIQIEIESFKRNLFASFNTVQVVCLTRHYDNHSVNHYLFISSYFKNDHFKIIIPMDFNHNVLSLLFLDVQSNWSFAGDPRKKYLYDNFHQYAEFLENVNGYNSVSLQSVCVVNFNVSLQSPILSNSPKNPTNSLSCERQAQLILKIIPNYSNNIEMQLLYNRKILKEATIENNSSNRPDVIPHLDKFIFPLAESFDLITKWDMKPELSFDFMSQDFEPYWLLKDMESI